MTYALMVEAKTPEETETFDRDLLRGPPDAPASTPATGPKPSASANALMAAFNMGRR